MNVSHIQKNKTRINKINKDRRGLALKVVHKQKEPDLKVFQIINMSPLKEK